ncbi:hypothetical protein F53441_8394 [Fusarium austroafricanum]|uniref:Peptidase S8/S53 domain-containing protein n=1 Tax=Fusarium austroafricanum TaxID=2364996 RepID=A0A8H4KE87_9HYPO|nr:hypothetical protein F53441_8394 [Fusarium austroafricanum]
MDNASLWDYARKSAREVSVLSAQLSAKESQVLWQYGRKRHVSKRLGELAGYLLLTYFDSSKHEDGKAEKSPDRTEMFLEGLERICTWPREVIKTEDKKFSNRFPTLSALLKNASLECEPWRVEGNLIAKVETSLRAFVSNEKPTIKRYFDFLKSFSSTKEHIKKNAEVIRTDISGKSRAALEAPNDYPAHVLEAFYNVLRRYAESCCPVEPICLGRHDGKLRLKENFQTRDDNVLFDTVLSRIPPHSTGHGIEWQHLQFHVARSKKQASMKSVGFASRETSAPTTNTDESQYADTIETEAQFCDLVRKRVGPAKLKVKVSGERLLQFRDLEGIDDDVAHEQTITLADMLKHQNLGPKTRLLIAYILVRSFWQFYNSDWMCAQWNTESVQFFRQRTDNDKETKDESILEGSPYFAFSFEENDSLLSAEYLASVCVVHRYPRVLALAGLLYDIGRRRRRRTETPHEYISVEEKISNDFNDIRRGLQRDTWTAIKLQPEVQQTYKAVVENCIDPKLFEADGDSPGGITIDERRSILHRKIVYPLQALLQKLNWIDNYGNIRRKEYEDLNDTKLVLDIADSPTQATFLNVSEPLNSRQASSSFKSEQWLRRIQDSGVTASLVKGFKGKQPPSRVRIAVLDTGYDPDVVMFQNPHHKRRLRDWKDFAAGSGARQDEDGHGTHVLSLIMKVAPAADIYVARVAKDTTELESSARNISEAIAWAASICEADIISMSFGFDEEPPFEGDRVISNAISNALASRRQQILFFAAAANEGANQSEMFPASHPQVMSIRGTDTKGWLERFSPPPGDNGTCFMTLGKDVPGASLSQDGSTEICQSGTSTSTPIAAGIAAMVLSYARLNEGVLEERCGTWQTSHLWTTMGMSSPNFTYHVNTSICMGDIIQDPSDPTKPLSSQPESMCLETESHIDYDNTLSKTTSSSLHGSIWAKFLETVNANVGGGVSNELINKYTMDRLETIYYKKQPTDEEAAERVKHPKVKAATKSGYIGKSPVYMITGLKVARGFRVESGKTSTKEGNAGLQAPVTSEVDLGAEVSISRTDDTEESYRSGQDIIFAYQLHVISHKGWRQKETDIRVHKSKAAFLHEHKEGVEEEPMEIQHATEDDVREFDDEMPVEVLVASDGEEPCVDSNSDNAEVDPRYLYTQNSAPESGQAVQQKQLPLGWSLWAWLALTALISALIVGGAVGGGLGAELAHYSGERDSEPYAPKLPKDITNLTKPDECSRDGGPNRLQATKGQIFNFWCSMDHTGGDIGALVAYTLKDCLDACAENNILFKRDMVGNRCTSAVFSWQMSWAWENHKANCWFKNTTGETWDRDFLDHQFIYAEPPSS